MKYSISGPASCHGNCEFSGDIPGGAPLQKFVPVIFGNESGNAERGIVFLDDQLRFSAGIVDAAAPDKAPDPHALGYLIANCTGKCALKAAGYESVAIPTSLKREATELTINSLAGPQSLSEVKFLPKE